MLDYISYCLVHRARLTVPHYLGIIDYSDGEVGIIATEPISNKTQLGPFEAKKTCNIDRDDVFILKVRSRLVNYYDNLIEAKTKLPRWFRWCLHYQGT